VCPRVLLRPAQAREVFRDFDYRKRRGDFLIGWLEYDIVLGM
jgi:hypothetical protein